LAIQDRRSENSAPPKVFQKPEEKKEYERIPNRGKVKFASIEETYPKWLILFFFLSFDQRVERSALFASREGRSVRWPHHPKPRGFFDQALDRNAR
jgi:hypothetical protein